MTDVISRLEQRAERMATAERVEQTGTQLALFRRHGVLYGFAVSDVVSAGRVRSLSPVPGAEVWVAGVTLHLGKLLTLIDIPRLWGEVHRGVFDLPSFLVVTNGRTEIGIVAEQVLGMCDIREEISSWKSTPRPGIHGATRFEEENVLVLGARELLQTSPFSGA